MMRLPGLLGVHQKAWLRNVGRKCGFEVRRNSLRSRDDLRLLHFLKSFGVSLVLDVGANRGQFAESLFRGGYTGNIVSFEALPNAHDALKHAAATRSSSWIVAPCLALSDQPGILDFHVTRADTASSLFLPAGALTSVYSPAHLETVIRVQAVRLDDVVAEMGLVLQGGFLKLDVQGSEALVLSGATKVLSVACGLIVELSLTELYVNQPSARDVLEILHKAGFEVWDVWQGYRDPFSHRLNQIDLVCFKPDARGN